MEGKVYYNQPGGYFHCVDLRTGELLWEKPGSVTMGWHIKPELYQTEVLDAIGILEAYLWGGLGSSQWKQYDPLTGNLIGTYQNSPTSTHTISWRDGDPNVYITQRKDWDPITFEYGYVRLMKWNYDLSSTSDWTTGVLWNVSIRQPDGKSIGDGRQSVRCYVYPEANIIICSAHNDENRQMAFDMTTGDFLWYKEYDFLDIPGTSHTLGPPSGPIMRFNAVDNKIYAYDVKTGNEIWATEIGVLPWGNTPAYYHICDPVSRTLYWFGFDGYCFALDLDTGAVKWQSEYVGDTTETVQGTWPFGGSSYAGSAGGNPGAASGDGKVYMATSNVYRLQPKSRFNRLYCFDADTGDIIWSVRGGIAVTSLADGYLLGVNDNDGMLYCFGKGKTEIDVGASPSVVEEGSAVLITGTITDQSPGQEDTPCVADEDMSVWMDYLHMQNATLINNPPAPNGVPVSLAAIDPNGNYVEIATVTSDTAGMFKKLWTPEIEGEYTIIANFEGSESYWSSYTVAAFGVTEATSPDVPIEPEEPTEFLISTELIIAIIIAIISIIGLATYWMLRKRQ
jgi:outer membrane protein assembly factor BamB